MAMRCGFLCLRPRLQKIQPSEDLSGGIHTDSPPVAGGRVLPGLQLLSRRPFRPVFLQAFPGRVQFRACQFTIRGKAGGVREVNFLSNLSS